MNNPTILVIDDEPQIRKLLEITLSSNGYEVSFAANAKEGLAFSANHPPEMIILDLGLPDENGHTLLLKLREWYTNPVLVLSVLSDEENIIKALDNGANDYLVKPFRTGELLARIRSAFRTTQNENNTPSFKCQELTLDLAGRTLLKNDEIIKLTSTEFSLIAVLMKNCGKVLTHRYLLKEVWGPGYINQSQYLRVFIAQLRKKIENDANHPQYIVTESGIGYRFICKNQ